MLREGITCYLGSHAFVSASSAANLGIPTCQKYIHFSVRNEPQLRMRPGPARPSAEEPPCRRRNRRRPSGGPGPRSPAAARPIESRRLRARPAVAASPAPPRPSPPSRPTRPACGSQSRVRPPRPGPEPGSRARNRGGAVGGWVGGAGAGRAGVPGRGPGSEGVRGRRSGTPRPTAPPHAAVQGWRPSAVGGWGVRGRRQAPA